MYVNVKQLEDISVEAINADIPRGLEFKSLAERITSMAHQTEMVGELEII